MIKTLITQFCVSKRVLKIYRCFSAFYPSQSNTQIQIEELSNGVKIVTEELESPLSCISMIIQTGPRFENSCNNGITNFIEHMVLSNKDLQENLYSKGMKIHSLTTREFQRFSAVCPNEYTPDCLDIFSKLIFNIELNETEIELQKKYTHTEALFSEINPGLLVFDYLHQTAFQGTPLALSVIGTTKNIANFDRNVLCNFMKENYQPHRVLLTTSGGVSHSSMVSKANSSLGFLSPSQDRTINFGLRRYTGSSIIYRNDSLPYAYVAIAVEVPGFDSEEYLTLVVANSLIGSWERTQGGNDSLGFPLARASSTSKLCEKFESFYIAYRDVGLWGVYFVGKRYDLDDMVTNIQDQWMQMCTMTTSSEVEKAVNVTKLKLAKQVDGVINSCHDIGMQMLYKSKRKSLFDFYNELSKVTETEIKSVGYNFIYDKCPVVAAVGPTETLPHYNRIRSGLDTKPLGHGPIGYNVVYFRKKFDMAVVLDTGSFSSKAGFAGESFPRCIIPTTTGRFRELSTTDGVSDIYFGNETITKRGILNLTWPIKNGMIDNWDEIEKLWHHIFYRELHVAPEESQVMMAIHPLTSKRDKEKISEILFESFTIQGLYLAISPTLVLHASGRTSGIVWECGHSCSYVSPVFEGFPLKHATVCSKINGNALTSFLQNLLARVGYSFTTLIEKEILEKIKSSLCYVSIDYERESKSSTESVPFELPDGQRILVGSERFESPELLFQPSLYGFDCLNIADIIYSSIYKCDIEYKGLFFDNILLSGGSSLFKGLSDRLSIELNKRIIDTPEIKATVDAMNLKGLGAWVGGSILASLDCAKGFWLTGTEYEDGGSERVHYKFY